MEKKYLQKLFSRAYIGMHKQNWKKSLDTNNAVCSYRGFNNRKCAIGHCINDEYYSSDIEGKIISDQCSVLLSAIASSNNIPISEIIVDIENHGTLIDLQECHDEFDDIKLAMDKFASRWDLEIPNIQD